MGGLLRGWRVALMSGPHRATLHPLCSWPPGGAPQPEFSRLFQPQNLREDEVSGLDAGGPELTCKSQRLMLQAGLIQPATPGCFHLLPFAVRALEKLVRLMDREMQAIGGQKVDMPALSSAGPWRASGRWDRMGRELFRLDDRQGHELCLGPTHEEVVTALVASRGGLSSRQLPLLLYQVTRKFRDEPKPRFGLLRAREFYMKDLYSFDASPAAARRTYKLVGAAYGRLFERLGLPVVRVQADTGHIGGSESHEFQLPAGVGEDRLALCPGCGFAANAETLAPAAGPPACPACGGPLTESKGIELGHTFYLGARYSSVFGATVAGADGRPLPAEMGCYGLGVSRILAAAVEVLSPEDCLRWPLPLAPYRVCLIPPKKGSREAGASVEALRARLLATAPQLQGEILLDDRTQLTIGRRLKDAQKLGYPFVVVAGRKVLEDPPLYEVWCQDTGQVRLLSEEGVVELLRTTEVV
ncbi:probable proline--tRNA ligase, mitochondrial [Ornithorhynchus anatinus]|nr:probable proline--tRNA ligase, mitochondrial [Ornithorhynchus anatinus]